MEHTRDLCINGSVLMALESTTSYNCRDGSPMQIKHWSLNLWCLIWWVITVFAKSFPSAWQELIKEEAHSGYWKGVSDSVSPCRTCEAFIKDCSAWQELNDKRLTLMEGSALSERDLMKARAESSSACLLLADRFSPKPEEEDLSLQFQVSPPKT